MARLRANADGFLSMSTNSENMPYEKMEEDLTCPVCLELYADPLMMPCSHSVCKTCLRDIMKSREKSGKKDLECPACRETHHFSTDKVNLLPKNLALENIVFRYQEICSLNLSRASQLTSPLPTSQPQPDMCDSPVCSPCHDISYRQQDSVFDESVEERFPCGMCEETEKTEAEWYCPQCQVLYCQVCLDTFHPRRGSLLKHKVRRPTNLEDSSNLLFCHDHPSEPASIFCDTCKIVACHLCVCVGHGAHCSHIILDLETAKKQLQESVETAQEKLAALLASFFERETDIGTHEQNSKAMEECARNSIINQYNCMMSDITDTLNIAKQKSLDVIAALGSSHSSHISSGNRHMKALMSRCDDLNEACKGFLETEDEGRFSFENQSVNSSFSSSIRSYKDQNKPKSKSNVPSRHLSEGSTLASGQPSDVKSIITRHSADVSSLSHGTGSDGSRYRAQCSASSRRYSSNEVKQSEMLSNSLETDDAKADGKFSLNAEPLAEDGSTVSRKSTNIGPKAQVSAATLELDCADGGDGTRKIYSKKFHSDSNELSNRKQNSKSLNQPKSRSQSLAIDEQSTNMESKDEICTDLRFSQLNLSLPQTQSQLCAADLTKKSLSNKQAADYLRNKQEENVGFDESQTVQREAFLQRKVTSKAKTRNQLLLRADEVGPILEQVSALSKQVNQEQFNRRKSLDASNKNFQQSIDLCVSGFYSSTLCLINSMTAHLPTENPVIIPCVRSVSVASPHQELSAPRVQSKVLMTWGFNSTTFIADPISSPAQWTVNINRNTSHIGDVKSGYLFGVGIATKSLNSKDQVGMSSGSHGIVCVNGGLAVCHAKQLSPIMPLSDLPMAVTISVNQSPDKCLYMTYKIRVDSQSKCLHGRRVISLSPNGQGGCRSGSSEGFTTVGSSAADTNSKQNKGCNESVSSQVSSGSHENDKGYNSSRSDQDCETLSHIKFDRSCTSQENISPSAFSIFPMFTVSQRVKMQFPQTSEV